MSLEPEPFEDDPFVNDMLDLALTDEEEADRLVAEADEAAGWSGRLLAAYRAQLGARRTAEALMAINRGFDQ